MTEVFRKISGESIKICEVSSKQTFHKSAIMGVDEIQVSVVVDSVLNIQENDYIVHNGVNYSLNREAEYVIESDVKYIYDLVFEHPFYVLLNKLVVNRITGLTSFILTGKLIDFVKLIVWCLNKTIDNPAGIDNGWSYGYIEDTDYINIHFSDINCYDALKLLSQELGVEFYFVADGKTINFVNTIENTTNYIFEQGSGKGLYKIAQQNVDKEDIVTRMYVRGGNKNIPNQYADEEGYLKLPENYLENFYDSRRIVEKMVKFEEEFPKFIGTIATVSGENNKVLTCPQINFDIAAIAVGDNARINFLSGDLMGASMKFSWQNSNKQITLIEQDDELSLPDSDGSKPAIPNSLKKVKMGDVFNFTGVVMPDSYVAESIANLRAKGIKHLSFFSKKRVKFTLEIDYRWMRGKSYLKTGDIVVISIPQNSFYKAIRITNLEINMHTGEISATVSNYLEDSWEKHNEYKTGLVIDYILSQQDNITIEDGIMHRDRGVWDAATSVIKPYLRNAKMVDDVWNIGCKWRCMTNKTLEIPSWTSASWLMIEGRSDVRMEFDSSNGLAFFAGAVDTVLTPIVFIGNTNVSDDIVEEQWRWTRQSGNQVADNIWNAQHFGVRSLNIKNEDMGPLWSKLNPIRFSCTATYPASVINEISNYIEL